MALLLRMREVLVSNFSTETGIVDDVYCELPQFLQQMSALVSHYRSPVFLIIKQHNTFSLFFDDVRNKLFLIKSGKR
jgi:predicted choloylglycine hydrolase